MASRVERLWNGQRLEDMSRVRSLGARLQELNPFEPGALEEVLLPKLARLNRRQERELFASEGAEGGEAWRPLSRRYAERKARMVGGQPILVWNGKLRRDLSRTGPDHIARLAAGTGTVMEFGARNRLGGIHTFDGVRRRIDTPDEDRSLRPEKIRRARRAKPTRRPAGFFSYRRRPTFSGSYEFVKRNVIQKTDEQRADFVRATAAYLNGRCLNTMRAANGLPRLSDEAAYQVVARSMSFSEVRE